MRWPSSVCKSPPGPRTITVTEPSAVRFAHADGRPFLLWAGAGLDARVMGNISLRLKRWLGRAGITLTAISEFLRYEFPRLEVSIDGKTHDATFAVVCRASRYAGNWIIAPDARMDGEALDVMLFSHRNHRDLLQLFRQMQLGQGGHLENGIARIVRGREVEIRSLESYPVEVEGDGDCILETPIRCRVGTESVQILVPAHGDAISELSRESDAALTVLRATPGIAHAEGEPPPPEPAPAADPVSRP